MRNLTFGEIISAVRYDCRAFCTTALLVASTHCLATETDSGAWTTLGLRHTIDHEHVAGIDVQLRHADDFNQLERLLVRPYLSFKQPRGQLTVGYDAHFVNQPKDTTEHRLWQEYLHQRQRQAWSNAFVLRLEQRFIESVRGIVWRIRPLFEIRYDLDGEKYLAARNEIHINANDAGNGPDAGFDQNRTFLVFGTRLSNGLRSELGYHLQVLDRTDTIIRHHVMVTIRAHF